MNDAVNTIERKSIMPSTRDGKRVRTHATAQYHHITNLPSVGASATLCVLPDGEMYAHYSTREAELTSHHNTE